MKRILTALVVLLLVSNVRSQVENADEKRLSFGVAGGGSLVMQQAAFEQLPGYPKCGPTFKSGSGMNPYIGVFIQIPTGDRFSLSIRGTFNNYGAELLTPERTTIATSSGPEQIDIEHSLSTSVRTLNLEPAFGFDITDRMTFNIHGAVGLVLGTSFEQMEMMPESGGTFRETGKRTQNEYSGELPSAGKLFAGFGIGVQYAFPLNTSGTLHALPEIGYTYGVTNIVSTLDWKASAARGGIAIRYTLPESPVDTVVPPPIKQPVEPVKVIAKPLLAASIRAMGLNQAGEEESVAVVRVEELYATHSNPLLNYVFFDEGQKEIPTRYHQLASPESVVFDLDSLKNADPIEVQHQVLNVIGKRMQEHSSATLQIIGCNSGQGVERNDRSLSQDRANAVATYLQDTWKIPASRLKINARNLPERSAPSTEQNGILENQRVEIYSSLPEILDPVITEDTSRTATPPVLRFYPQATAEAGVDSWGMTISQLQIRDPWETAIAVDSSQKFFKSYEGSGSLPRSVDWVIGEDQSRIPKFPGNLDVTLFVKDVTGQEIATTASVPIEQLTLRRKLTRQIAGRSLETYALTLFDFESAALSSQSRRTVNYIKDRIKDNSNITVVGYADGLGNDGFNLTLSKLRAQGVADALGVAQRATIEGRGESVELYNVDLPEARLLSRTVVVTVETPREMPN